MLSFLTGRPSVRSDGSGYGTSQSRYARTPIPVIDVRSPGFLLPPARSRAQAVTR
jgi:hypothetical protein